MKKLLIVGFSSCLLSMAPKAAHAGVSVDVHFGQSYRHHHTPPPTVVYTYPYAPFCHHPDYRPYSRPVIYVEPPQTVIVHEPLVVASAPSTTGENSQYQLGHDWAKDLRNDVATWDQFVNYLKSNLTRASTRDYTDFRNGFFSAYGVNGEAAFDKGYQQARSGQN